MLLLQCCQLIDCCVDFFFAGLPAEHVILRYNETSPTAPGVSFGTDVILVVDYDGAEGQWFDNFIDLLDPLYPDDIPVLNALNAEFSSYSVSNVFTTYYDGLPENAGPESPARLQQPGYWEQFLEITHIVSSTMLFPAANTSDVTELANLYLNATAAFACESHRAESAGVPPHVSILGLAPSPHTTDC